MKPFIQKAQELFSLDLKSLAMMRIFIAILIIIDLILRIPDIKAFYTDEGVLPRLLLISQSVNSPTISLHNLNGSYQFQTFLFLIAGFFAFLLLVGYRTKFVTFISWLLLCSLHIRNELVLSGGDTVLRLLLFWSLFMPLGARYSIDSILNSSKEKLPEKVFSMGTVGLFAQVAFIYWFTALLKLKYPEWLDGTAIFYSLKESQYAKPFAITLLNYPDLLKILTLAVLWFEIIGPFFLAFPFFTIPLRIATSLGLITLQMSFFLCFEVGFFPWSCSIAMLSFFPGTTWEKIYSRLNKILTLDSFQFFVNVIKTTYTKVSTSQMFKPFFVERTVNIKTPLILNVVAAFFVVYIFFWNLGTVYPKYSIPNKFSSIGYALVIGQHWFMFAPPVKFGCWPTFPGRLKDETIIDVHNSKPLTWERPALPSQVYKNQRWQTYVINLTILPNILNANIYHYATYLCNNWNKRHPEDKKLEEIEFYINFEHNTLEETSEPENRFLYKHECK